MVAELVTGKAEDFEVGGVFGFEGFVEGFERLELRSEAAFGGGVDHEDYFAFEGGEGVGRSGFFCFVSILSCYVRFKEDVLSTGSKSKKVVAEDMVLVLRSGDKCLVPTELAVESDTLERSENVRTQMVAGMDEMEDNGRRKDILREKSRGRR